MSKGSENKHGEHMEEVFTVEAKYRLFAERLGYGVSSTVKKKRLRKH